MFEMMSRWCGSPGVEGVEDILRDSTLIFMPEIPFTQVRFVGKTLSSELGCRQQNLLSLGFWTSQLFPAELS